MKIIKKLLAFFPFVFMIFAFYNWNLNPENWSKDSRVAFCIIYFIVSGFYLIVTAIHEESKK